MNVNEAIYDSTFEVRCLLIPYLMDYKFGTHVFYTAWTYPNLIMNLRKLSHETNLVGEHPIKGEKLYHSGYRV